MTPPRSSSRRAFLQASAGLAAASTAGSRVLGANETLNIGLIGVGGRCRALMKSLATIPNTRMTAVADIYDGHRETARAMVDPKAFVTKDYRALLDRKDVDAVLIAAPDHWHAAMTIDACNAGKDVYVEKPLTHSLEEGSAIIDAQNKNRRVVQVGTQQRSMPHFQKGYEIIKSGRIGTIHKVHLTWNRNQDRALKPPSKIGADQVDWKAFLGKAPDQPFDPYRLIGNWRWFWDFGGGLFTDLMVHYIDVVHWYLDLQHPTTAASIGDWFHAKGVWETPDTVQTLLTYPEKELQVYYEGTFSNARNGAMLEFMGTNGTLYLDRGRYELHPERGRFPYEEMVLGTGKRGADFYDKPDGELLHLTDWVDCVRTRKTPNAPAEAGVSAASAAHLANQALRSGAVARWS